MYPVKNPTKHTLQNLEHEVLSVLGEAMNTILDNGDRPDKRITAIIGLQQAINTVLKQLDKISESIPDSP